MELRWVLDGTEYAGPVNWDKLTESLTFDNQNQIYSFSFGEEYIWQGDAYNYLYSQFTSGNVCELVSVLIKIDGQTRITGNIFLSECTFNENRRFVSTAIEDAGYSSRITNNKGIDVAPLLAESKNGVAIALPAVDYTGLFDKDGVGGLTSVAVTYSAHNLLAYLVAWMSDGTVAFASDYFSTGAGSGLQITSGLNLRSHYSTNPSPPKTNFERLFDALRKLHNVAMGFTRSTSGQYTLRIEPLTWFRSSAESATITAPNDVELSFVKELLYASVQVGTNPTRIQDCDDGNTNCSAFVTASYFGCDTETYGLTGECNIDSQLNLVPDAKYHYDTNTIIDVFQYQNDRYDNDIFLIDTFAQTSPAPLTRYAYESDPLGLGEHWYNGSLMNNEVLLRWQNYLLGTMNLYSAVSGTGLFSASDFTTGTLLPDQTPVYNDVTIDPTVVDYNPQNVWSNITNRFTAAYDGWYQFGCGSAIITLPATPNGIIISTQLNVDHYDSVGTLINRYSSQVLYYISGDPSENYDYTSPFINMEATDYCIFTISYAQSISPGINQAEIEYGVTAYPLGRYGYFRCVAGMGLIQNQQVNTGANLAYIKRSFKIPLSDATYANIIADPSKAVRIASANDGQSVGWINSISRNFADESAEIELITTT
jgi:hypothetical protein